MKCYPFRMSLCLQNKRLWFEPPVYKESLGSSWKEPAGPDLKSQQLHPPCVSLLPLDGSLDITERKRRCSVYSARMCVNF